MAHILLANSERPWNTELKLRGKSRRRRLVERIKRFKSSPSLSTIDDDGRSQLLEDSKYPPQQSISCVSFSSGSETEVSESSNESSGLGSAREACGVNVGAASRGKVVMQHPRKQQGCDWRRLPDEVKMQILGWLGPMELVQCSVVSKEWHSMCFDGQLWSTLDASGFYNRIPANQLTRLIASAGSFVRHLNLRGCLQLHEHRPVESVASACQNLLYASLEGCNFKRTTLHGIVCTNPKLVHLNLSGLSAVTNTTCRIIAQCCPTIETLDLSFCTHADGRGLRRVVDSCKLLRQLRACELKISDSHLFQAMFKNNTMEKLYLGDCGLITDEFIRIMVQGIEPDLDVFTSRNLAPPRKLRHLDLGKCVRLTDFALRHLADNVPLLEGLELGGIPALTDVGFATLLPTLPKLSHLDLEECVELSNTTLLNLAQAPLAKTLVHLQVSYCENVGDAGMVEVLRRCEKLRNLEMDNTRVSDVTLGEAAHIVCTRNINHERPVTASPASNVALRLVVFDCANITWTGIREVLTRNKEAAKPKDTNDARKPHIVQLKCYYEYQRTVDEHTKLVLRGDLDKADIIERRWAEHMMAREESESGRRRRRRQRDNAWGGNDIGAAFGMGRRRGRVSCSIM